MTDVNDAYTVIDQEIDRTILMNLSLCLKSDIWGQ